MTSPLNNLRADQRWTLYRLTIAESMPESPDKPVRIASIQSRLTALNAELQRAA